MSAAITHEAPREHFAREGYAIFRNVLDTELIAEASDHVDWLQARNPSLRPELLDHELLGKDPFWLRLVGDSRLLDVAEQFIGPNIALFASHYISKPPRDGKAVLWHQDGSYWPLVPMEVVSLWLSIDHATAENGCMRVIPGTQGMDLQEMKKRADLDSVFGSGMDTALVDETIAVDFLLAPGDVSVHHPNLIHGSGPNHSPHRRCGLTIRYIPTTTRIVCDTPWPSSFLLRGTHVAGINEYLPFPRYVAGRHMPFRGCEGWAIVARRSRLSGIAASDLVSAPGEPMTRKLISSGSIFEEQIGYSRAVVDGDWIFVSGTTGFDYSTMSISADISEQTEQCLRNIEAALRQAESSLKDVVRVTYILPNGAEFAQCWPVLRNYFGEIRPAATMISAGLVDPRIKIEIEVTARKPS